MKEEITDRLHTPLPTRIPLAEVGTAPDHSGAFYLIKMRIQAVNTASCEKQLSGDKSTKQKSRGLYSRTDLEQIKKQEQTIQKATE